MRRCWLEISLDRLTLNLRAIQKRLSDTTEVYGVVKANGYGHGLVPVARKLYQDGLRRFAVATLAEGIQLRQSLPLAKEILVFSGCSPGEEKEFLHYDLTASWFDDRPLTDDLKVQMEVDTGMNRLGVPWVGARRLLEQIRSRLSGIYSHFAAAENDPDFTRQQLERFHQVSSNTGLFRHISNSAGLQFKEAYLDAVRPGLALVGISPCPAIDFVRPIMSWKTRILTINQVSAGGRIGYGATFTVNRDSRIAVLPVGYADGYSWKLSNCGLVRLGSQLAPVVGRINMDLTTVDVTDVKNLDPQAEVTLLDSDANSPISVGSLAKQIGTIPYEVLTSITSRVDRVYLESDLSSDFDTGSR